MSFFVIVHYLCIDRQVAHDAEYIRTEHLGKIYRFKRRAHGIEYGRADFRHFLRSRKRFEHLTRRKRAGAYIFERGRQAHGNKRRAGAERAGVYLLNALFNRNLFKSGAEIEGAVAYLLYIPRNCHLLHRFQIVECVVAYDLNAFRYFNLCHRI